MTSLNACALRNSYQRRVKTFWYRLCFLGPTPRPLKRLNHQKRMMMMMRRKITLETRPNNQKMFQQILLMFNPLLQRQLIKMGTWLEDPQKTQYALMAEMVIMQVDLLVPKASVQVL